jgi:hypothetical protein
MHMDGCAVAVTAVLKVARVTGQPAIVPAVNIFSQVSVILPVEALTPNHTRCDSMANAGC